VFCARPNKREIKRTGAAAISAAAEQREHKLAQGLAGLLLLAVCFLVSCDVK